MVNPTFSLGTYSFANLRAFMENRATSFIGLTPEATFVRDWPFWLAGAYVQDEFRVHPRRDAECRPALGVHDDADRSGGPRFGAGRT